MLNFKEFQKECDLPLDRQKECYKWYIEGYTSCACAMKNYVEDNCGRDYTCDDCCPKFFVEDFIDDMEKELKNAETEEN